MNITMRDIAQTAQWQDVDRAMKYFYPNDIGNYKKVFEFIKKTKKKAPKEKMEYIDISTQGSILKPEDIYYRTSTNRYSLSFRAWNEVSNIPIEMSTLDHYMPAEILAHFIWEITFYGNEKQMNAKAKELAKAAKNIKKNNKLKK